MTVEVNFQFLFSIKAVVICISIFFFLSSHSFLHLFKNKCKHKYVSLQDWGFLKDSNYFSTTSEDIRRWILKYALILWSQHLSERLFQCFNQQASKWKISSELLDIIMQSNVSTYYFVCMKCYPRINFPTFHSEPRTFSGTLSFRQATANRKLCTRQRKTNRKLI